MYSEAAYSPFSLNRFTLWGDWDRSRQWLLKLTATQSRLLENVELVFSIPNLEKLNFGWNFGWAALITTIASVLHLPELWLTISTAEMGRDELTLRRELQDDSHGEGLRK